MMKPKNAIVGAVLFLFVVLSVGCSKLPTSDLKELGFYTVISGKAQHQSFKEYESGSTKQSLPATDFPKIPVLSQGDYFLIYGDLPAGPLGTSVEVFPYMLDGNIYKSQGNDLSLESFFAQEPMDPVRGVKLTKLTPKDSIAAGTYLLHRYVGMNGDAYLAFRIER